MLWQVGTTSPYTAGGDDANSWTYARVAYYVTSSYGSSVVAQQNITYLGLSSSTAWNTSSTDDYGLLYSLVDGGNNGAGGLAVLPTTNPSAYTYFIELGNYDGSTWNAVARSEGTAWNNIAKISNEDLNNFLSSPSAFSANVWTGGGNYSPVPEPTSSLMLLVGLSMLALRRRRG